MGYKKKFRLYPYRVVGWFILYGVCASIHLLVCLSVRLFVCPSVLKKTLNNFWMERQNWMKFSEVAVKDPLGG